MFKILCNGETKEYNEKVRLIDIAPKDKPYYLAKVNNRLRELFYEFSYDATVEFLDLTSYDVARVYEASLRYLIVMATKSVEPSWKLTFNYSVSKSIFCNVYKQKINRDFLERLDKKMQEIIQENLPINRITVSKAEAKAFYEQNGDYDKVAMLEFRHEENVHLYQCKDYKNYMFSYMVPYTGLLKDYKLRLYGNGFIIQYPRSEAKGVIPPFMDDYKFGRTLADELKWLRTVPATNIAEMNRYIENNQISDYVNMCETKHNNMMYDLGMQIKDNIENIKLICVAGPSSSGKTTFTNRLRIELMTLGIRPLMISLDDYYLPREKCPIDEYGKPDFEHIDALDVELFNKQMIALINGEEVLLPEYDFKSNARILKRKAKLSENTPILIEGIHALNEKMTQAVPKHQKFKIYISPQSQYHIDDQNPISITDIRLIRRIVRDKQFRNTSAVSTLEMWPSVRRGEFKWIYPNQENADYVYNSELTYELHIMKKYAYPALKEIPSDSEYFIQANRLLKFLKYFDDIPDEYVPANSLLREFIGGSSYYL